MIDGIIIKVCGMRDAENIQAVESIEEVDMLGFIFYPQSPRYVDELPYYLPARAHRVGVFVNEEAQTVCERAGKFGLEYIQLHGNESPEYCRSLQKQGLKVIKAFSIATTYDLDKTGDYEGSCHLFLFDTKCEQYGGSGSQFDWSILRSYTGSIPFLLSGGIHPGSAKELKEFTHPSLAGYDLNSRFERQPGWKDPERISQFLNELKSQRVC